MMRMIVAEIQALRKKGYSIAAALNSLKVQRPEKKPDANEYGMKDIRATREL
jgi:hypothetical protein